MSKVPIKKNTNSDKGSNKPRKLAVKKTLSRVTRGVTKRVTTTKEREIVVASEEKAFYATNGAVLHSLPELYTELSTMSDSDFNYHANLHDNHFSRWVQDVLSDKDCADALRTANTRRKARSAIKRHLEKYNH